MSRFFAQSYYEILDLDPGATAMQIKDAFRDAQRSFDPSSPVLHSMYDPDEAAAINMKLIEAFEILANPDRRARYDRYLAHKATGFRNTEPRSFFNDAHRSEERVPAPPDPPSRPSLKAIEGGEEKAPDTGKVLALRPAPEPELEPPAASPAAPAAEPEEAEQDDAPRIASTSGAVPSPSPVAPVSRRGTGQARRISVEAVPDDELERLVEEHGWSGPLLKAVRERAGVSLDDVCTVTKINIQYLRSIEGHVFDELPAKVYLRGFLKQVAQLLKLPAKRFTDGYLEQLAE